MSEEISRLRQRLLDLSEEFEEASRDESEYRNHARTILFTTAQELNSLAVEVGGADE